MGYRRIPASRRTNPRRYRKNDAGIEWYMQGQPDTIKITGKAVLIRSNGTIDGAVGIIRDRTKKTLAIQHWTKLLYSDDMVPRKWIIPILEYRNSNVKLGKPYVEKVTEFGERVKEIPELEGKEQNQLEVLLNAIEKELCKNNIPKKTLSSSLKGQIKKCISPEYSEKASQNEKEVYYDRFDIELPRKVI